MNSKIEARIEAVKLAINVEGVTSDNIVATSEAIYGFILGDAELPDTHDTKAEMKELMEKMLPNPSFTPTAKNHEETDTETAEKA